MCLLCDSAAHTHSTIKILTELVKINLGFNFMWTVRLMGPGNFLCLFGNHHVCNFIIIFITQEVYSLCVWWWKCRIYTPTEGKIRSSLPLAVGATTDQPQRWVDVPGGGLEAEVEERVVRYSECPYKRNITINRFWSYISSSLTFNLNSFFSWSRNYLSGRSAASELQIFGKCL